MVMDMTNNTVKQTGLSSNELLNDFNLQCDFDKLIEKLGYVKICNSSSSTPTCNYQYFTLTEKRS